jgi:CheY-like chemotaxis protein
VNRIVQKIGGDCKVKSELGLGSLFTIRTNYAVLNESSLLKNRKHAESTHSGDNTINTSLNEWSNAANNFNLGIIENDYSLQNAYAQYFSKAGYSVHLIPYGENEFKQYLEEIPKLHFILSDFRLGDRNGIYFIQQLREEFNEDIPACIVTADTSPQHLQLFDQLNIHVLYKPIDIQSIEKFIARSLR